VPDVKGHRPYDGSRRTEGARQTRRRILDAAHEELAEHGYAGTTMRAVAERAGVSVKTVEAAFGTKANLVKELVDVRIAGDDEPVAISDRPAVAEMVAEPDPLRMIRLHAVFVADIARRSVVVNRVAMDASASAPELATIVRTNLTDRRFGARAMVESLATKAPLRLDVETAADAVWVLLDPHQYDLLVHHAGWTHERYVDWLTDVQERLLLA
jgi:AcrR family transcriptional regulator